MFHICFLEEKQMMCADDSEVVVSTLSDAQTLVEVVASGQTFVCFFTAKSLTAGSC